jgi:hypothetical protein
MVHAEVSSADSSKLNWLRAAVLGANDGIVSVSALIVGVAGATNDPRIFLITGVAGILSGALSMAVGEYVSVSSFPTAVMPVITDGYPSGQISAGNPLVEISVKTNQLATCRYGTVASTTYASLPYSFSTYDGESFFADLSGLVDNTAYTYYVRCRSFQGAENDTDYVISFNLAPTPETTNSVEGSASSAEEAREITPMEARCFSSQR